MRLLKYIISFSVLLFLACCGDKKPVEEINETPTSGKLKIYYNEALSLQLNNQAYTFKALYPNANVEVVPTNENEAVRLLLADSCESIVINRLFNDNEKKAFDQRDLHPAHSQLARTGVALIVGNNSPIHKITVEQVIKLLGDKLVYTDSLNRKTEPVAVFDNKNSAVTRYLKDSLLDGNNFGPQCSATGNNIELLKVIAENPNAIGFIDFAWLSDRDDSLYKAWEKKVKFISVGKTDSIYFAPNQSSFKTGEYPFTRTIYYIRRTGDFTLAKGFEAFMAGPKGQMLFLKQGLLPNRQQERNIEVNMGQK